MRNTLQPDLSPCDYVFTNLSVGYSKRRSSLRESLSELREKTHLETQKKCLHSPTDTY